MRILVLSSLSRDRLGGCAGPTSSGLRRGDVAVDEAPLAEFGGCGAEPDLVVLHSDITAGLSRTVVKLRRKWDETPILGCFCSSGATPAGISRALSAGIDDYLTCPVGETELVPRVERLLRGREARLAGSAAERRVGFSFKNLVGESERFLSVVELVPRLGNVDGTLLITGETGTGKELFARAIHYAGPRKGKPFVPVNCGALPDQLVENELFGHAKGAFTDASAAEHGLVGESEGGTLFLDEVEALTPSAQAKLLRFLQDHEYRPLGSPKTQRADVRVVAATNVDLRAEVEARRYRADLFYRLSVLLLRIPPLRDRAEDVSLLAAHFAKKYSRQEARPVPRLSDAVLAMLEAHDWPGNVRELEAVIQRSVLMATSQTLEPADIDLGAAVNERAMPDGRFHAAKSNAIRRFERSYLTRVLTAHGGNVSQAARTAGTHRRALQRLMRKHRIDRRAFIT